MLRKTELKVKIKSLAAESKIIRKEIIKAGKSVGQGTQLYLHTLHAEAGERDDDLMHKAIRRISYHNTRLASLVQHKDKVVRKVSRTTNIAYGLMLGHSYPQIENKCRATNPPDWKRVKRTLQNFGIEHHPQHNSILAHIAAWEGDKIKDRDMEPSEKLKEAKRLHDLTIEA